MQHLWAHGEGVRLAAGLECQFIQYTFGVWQDRLEMASAEGLIPLEDMGKAALAMVTMAPEVNVLSSVILPVTQPYLGRG